MAKHNCQAVGCPKVITTTKLMCPPHWATVPADLRSEVYATFRAYERRCNDPAPGAEVSAEKRAYYDARGRAVAAVARTEGRLRDSVCVFILRGDRIAAIRSAKHEYRPEIPGGKLDLGETHEAAARREILEELGVEVLDLERVTSLFVRIPSRAELHACVAFVARIDPAADLRGSDEGPAGWITRQDLIEFGTYRAQAPRLLAALDKHLARKAVA